MWIQDYTQRLPCTWWGVRWRNATWAHLKSSTMTSYSMGPPVWGAMMSYSGSIVVTNLDSGPEVPGSSPEWVPIFYEARSTAQGLPEPSSLWGSTLGTSPKNLGSVTSRRFFLICTGFPSVTELVSNWPLSLSKYCSFISRPTSLPLFHAIHRCDHSDHLPL